jgi:bacterioferritin-associated ferredoxin
MLNLCNSPNLIMYVCLCRAVTDSQIKDAIDQGVNSYTALRNKLGVAQQCGKCACEVKEILATHTTQHTEPSDALDVSVT